MNKNLYTFYVAIIDNEVVCYETNLKAFAAEFAKISTDTKNYDWFHRKFKASPKFSHEFKTGIVYFFQKVV